MQCIPARISAGLTLDLTLTVTAYPPPDWTLTLVLRGKGIIDLTSVVNGAAHRISVSPGVTAGWTPGFYNYELRASDGSDIVRIESGRLEILPDLMAQAEGYDGRGHAQRVLDAIEAVIEGRASKSERRYRINNRELEQTSIEELLMLRSRYREYVRQERAAARGRNVLGQQVLARFR